ncbi:hypothetical protein HanPSC8_Chr01g0021851 [Helianthus annuus]|nr:hypothetical protein HanPSC8_Chr01g0021851 [Helianthus annuus]
MCVCCAIEQRQEERGETLVSPSSSNSVGVSRKIGCMNPKLQTSNLVQSHVNKSTTEEVPRVEGKHGSYVQIRTHEE